MLAKVLCEIWVFFQRLCHFRIIDDAHDEVGERILLFSPLRRVRFLPFSLLSPVRFLRFSPVSHVRFPFSASLEGPVQNSNPGRLRVKRQFRRYYTTAGVTK